MNNLDQAVEVQSLLSKLKNSGILRQVGKTPEDTIPSTSGSSPRLPSRDTSPLPVPSKHRLDIIERRSTPGTAMKEFNMRTFF